MKPVSALLVVFALFLGLITIEAEARNPKPLSVYSGPPIYSQILCKQPLFFCYKVKKGDTWEGIESSNEYDVAVLMRINRMNIPLKPGMVIAVPGKVVDWEHFLSFPARYSWVTEKTIIISFEDLAFAAYDIRGVLMRSGPISAGKGCPGKHCPTPTGRYRVFLKYGPKAISSLYPIVWGTVIENGKKKRVIEKRGGARTPWFMAIVGHIGMHGFEVVPGYNASAGCIRMFVEDAEWLNQSFVEVDSKNKPGTLVIVVNSLNSLPKK